MRVAVVAVMVCFSVVGLSVADPSVAAATRRPITIAPQELGLALQELARDRDFQIVCRADLVRGLRTRGIEGDLTSFEALTELLNGSGLTYRSLDDRTVTIVPEGAGTPEGPRPAGGASKEQTPAPSSRHSIQQPALRVAQVGDVANNDSTPPPVSTPKGASELDEVVVTGSRLQRAAKEGAQEVHVFTTEQIRQSGQSTVADFLNTVPAVSLSTAENGFQTIAGSSTVNLRGLPIGTTLVLINGRRIENSGGASAYGNEVFDLNLIPLTAVERIELVADGSSAVYGSDAIAGVVNIIMKKDFKGLEADVKYGWANGMHDTTASVALGEHWSRGSLSIVGSYLTRSALSTSARKLSASNDYTAYGGPNANGIECNPGNVFSLNGQPLPGAPAGSNAVYAAVGSTATSGRPSFTDFNYGSLNQCSFERGAAVLPHTNRGGVFIQGTLSLTDSAELFTEVMYSRLQQDQGLSSPGLYGIPTYQVYTVSADNPYNPFGTAVGVTDQFTDVSRAAQYKTDFFRPLVGIRGSLVRNWQWEVSAWESADWTTNTLINYVSNSTAIRAALNSSDPATALNPFVVGSPGAIQSYYSSGARKLSARETSVQGFIRGPAVDLPAGPIQVLLGSEYDRTQQHYVNVNDGFDAVGFRQDYHRSNYSFFGEARIPILASRTNPANGELLAATAAVRHDRYSDFGVQNTPQFGVEIRPLESLLLRGTYARAFKAPPLYDLYSPVAPSVGTAIVVDPRTGASVPVSALVGGNPALRPLTGESHTFGFVYSSRAIPDLQLSVTHWNVNENDAIQSVGLQFIVDNENLFPDRVTRNSAGTITEVNDASLNFGSIRVSGLDYQLNYRYASSWGTWTPTLASTQTLKYEAALIPGSAPVDGAGHAQFSNDWSPRWKGTAALGWSLGSVTANVDGRYVGRYQDYGTTREIGNFWLMDANVRYAIGRELSRYATALQGIHLELGAVNLFNTMPQYSNYSGYLGYDPTQGDIRGRYLYVQLGAQW